MTGIKPQAGPQEKFLSSPADIAIYGGAAGGGKTFGLLIEALRHKSVPGFGAVIFRREAVQITNEGGLWDTAMGLYPLVGGAPFKSPKLGFRFGVSRVTFAHLNRDSDVLDWQGAQVAMIGFDELTHFSRGQFFYMLSRNRSTCGIRPYIRCTTNPDAECWVSELIAWWIDQDTGYPIPERACVIRYFARVDDTLHWADSREALAERFGISVDDAKSLTFIPASVTDNPALLSRDPGYLANLRALSRVERERLLGGNWKIKPAAGLYFQRADVDILEAIPADVLAWVRAWDLAATEPGESAHDPSWTAGVLMGIRANGKIVVGHMARDRKRAAGVRDMIRRIAAQDTRAVKIIIPQDPGQAGKDQAGSYVAELAGHSIETRSQVGDKITRAEPFAAQWQAGNVAVVRGAWNDAFFSELESFPTKGAHDDQVDACSDAYAVISRYSGIPTIGRPRAGANRLDLGRY